MQYPLPDASIAAASPPLRVTAPAVKGEVPAERREPVDATLAKNLVVARVIAGMTQHELAAAAGISRATIAQLETGYSDPRLSTVVDLATALGITPLLLLLNLTEVKALVELQFNGGEKSHDPLRIPPADLAKMLDFVQSGMLKDRLRAAQLGAKVARQLDQTAEMVPMAAGILSAILPGRGTCLGVALGKLFPTPR